jgi:hypothetical protein
MPDTSLGRALAELVDDVEAGDSLRARVARRERRGWRRPGLLAAAAVLVVIARVGGAVVIADDGRDTRPVVSGPGTTTTTAPSNWNPKRDGFAIWPVVTEAQLDHIDAEQRHITDPLNAAMQFAIEVLGWHDVSASAREPDGGLVDITGVDGSAVIGIRRHAARIYLVDYVWTFGSQEPSASVFVGEGRAEVHFSATPPAGGSASVIVRKGEHAYEATDLPTADANFANVEISEVGSVLVRLYDAGGRVVGAWGTVLPQGPFAAG